MAEEKKSIKLNSKKEVSVPEAPVEMIKEYHD